MGWIFLVLLIGWPVLEIAIFIQVGEWIGLFPTILLFLGAGVVGTWLLRAEGISLLMRAQSQMREGIAPVREGFDALCLVAGGVLLILPGFLSDILALALFLPVTRSALRRLLVRSLERRQGPPHAPPQGVIIEGEFEEVTPPRDVVRRRD
jgi:UPF0716 protein FxsA